MALTKIDGEFTSPNFADQDIVTTGDVGIGTTAPIANLDIAPASSSASLRVHARSDSSAVPAIELMRGTNTTFGADLYQDFRLKNSAGELIVEYGQSGSISEALRVDSLGNVGIGTTSPSVLLHMAANEPQFYIQDANSTGNNVNATIQFRDSSNTQLSYLGYAGSSDSHFSLFNTMSGGDLRFGTASTERMRIDSSGRVGIGTTSPGTPLHIANQYPSIRLQSNTGSYQQRSTVGQFDNIMYIECDNDNAVASSAMAFTVDASEKMRIDSSGRVLIGTATEGNADADALTISSTGGYTGITLRSDTNQGGAIYFSDATSGAGEYDGYITYAQSNQSMSFGTAGNGSPRMLIDSSGNIAVGRTSASSRLDLQAASGRTKIILRNVGNEADNSTFIAAETSPTYDIIVAGRHAVRFFSNLNEKARIDSSGRLLVGTSSDIAPDGFGSQIQSAALDYTSSITLRREGNNASGTVLNLVKTRSTTLGGNTSVQNGDMLGGINFYGADGTDTNSLGGYIRCLVDGTPGANDMPGRLVFSTTADGASSPTERMRINNKGETGVACDSTGWSFGVYQGGTAGTTNYLITGNYGSSTPLSGGTRSFGVFTNGNVVNTNDSYGAISDIKLKENIVDADSQWDDFKAVRFRKYNFKEETGHETFTQLGVIAQELEQVCPGLVDETPDRDEEGNDLGTTTKSVKYSILTKKALVALQEAMERIETLEASNADLLARVSALEASQRRL